MHPLVSYNEIKKRTTLLENSTDNIDIDSCNKYYNAVKNTGDIVNVRKFFNEVAKDSNCNEYLCKCVGLLNVSYNRYYDELKKFIVVNLLPKASKTALKELASYTDDEEMSKAANNAILKNEACSRIVANHNTIISNSNIEEMLEDTHRKYNNRTITEKVCNIVDNFNNMPLYAKVNTSIEEMSYDFNKYNIPYDEHVMVEDVLRYYRHECKEDKDMDNIKHVIFNNCFLSSIGEFFDPSTPPVVNSESDVYAALSKFFGVGDKQQEDYAVLQSSVASAPTWDLMGHASIFFEGLQTVLTSASNELSDYIMQELPKFYDQVYEAHSTDTDVRALFNKIAEALKKELSVLPSLISSYNDDEHDDRFTQFKIIISELFDEFNQSADFLYTSYNIECMNNTTDKQIPMNEFKLFKFNNVIMNCIAIDNYLKQKINKLKAVGLLKFKSFKSKIFKEAEVYDVVNPDGSIDYCIESLILDKSLDCSSAHDVCTNLVKEINTSILRNTDYKCYYQINPDNIEFRIRSYESVNLDDDDKSIIEGFNSTEDIDRVSILMSMSGLLDENFDFTTSVSEYLYKNRKPTLGGNQADIIIKAYSMVGLPKPAIQEVFDIAASKMDTLDKIAFLAENASLLENYTPADSDDETIIESLFMLETLIEEDKNQSNPNKPGEKKPSIKDTIQNKVSSVKNDLMKAGEQGDQKNKNVKNTNNNKKQPVADADKQQASDIGINAFQKNINSIKLMLKGISFKAKDLGQKEKEVSKNADSAFARLTKSAKDLLISDRREAIIKGSVIPSFSKCIKIGVILAGMGIVTQNPIIPAIALIGGIAVSKRLTRKERMLLMDDIEVELDVIDKEISMAESRNQMKKMRTLMRTKKDLQRQYQRIKYNIRVGQELLPAGVGTSSSSDEYEQ